MSGNVCVYKRVSRAVRRHPCIIDSDPNKMIVIREFVGRLDEQQAALKAEYFLVTLAWPSMPWEGHKRLLRLGRLGSLVYLVRFRTHMYGHTSLPNLPWPGTPSMACHGRSFFC